MRVLHYMPGGGHPGGVGTYLDRVTMEQRRRGIRVEMVDWALDAASITALARTSGADVIHMHTDCNGLIREVPMVLTLHGHQPYCFSGGRFLRQSLSPCDRKLGAGCLRGYLVDRCGSLRPQRTLDDVRRTVWYRQFRSRGRIVAVSNYLRQELVRNGFPAQRVSVVPLPVPLPPPSELTSPSPDGRVLFAGRITPNKGLTWLLRAVALDSRLTLDVAGDGPELRGVSELIDQLSIRSRVTFHRWQPPDRIAELMKASTLVVVPSVWHEPAGLVAAEASAWARPLVCADVGGLTEWVSESGGGYLVKPNDVSGLGAAVRKLIDDPDLATNLGQLGRRHAERVSRLDAHVDQLECIYKEVIGER